MANTLFNATKFFHPDEFKCPCGCGQNEMLSEFMDKLAAARFYANIPFVINSGFRCPSHNKAVGGTIYSSHMAGRAADINVPNSRARFKILESLVRAGFTRVGVGENFIHVDDDPAKDPQVVWLYS
jgi:zinc D-Ala-D-Ala carboxypeptidase